MNGQAAARMASPHAGYAPDTPPAHPSQSPTGPAQTHIAPAERLARSRERLRRVLAGEAQTSAHRAADGSAGNDGGESPVSTFMKLAGQWWSNHPVRQAAQLASGLAGPVAEAVLKPIAQNNPWRMLLGAAALGAALVWVRPWRWLPQAALSSVLLSTLLPRGGLSRWLASGGWLSLLTSEEARRWLASLGQPPQATSEPTPDPRPPNEAPGPSPDVQSSEARTKSAQAASQPNEPAGFMPVGGAAAGGASKYSGR